MVNNRSRWRSGDELNAKKEFYACVQWGYFHVPFYHYVWKYLWLQESNKYCCFFFFKSKAYCLRMFCNYNYILLVWSSKIFLSTVKMYNVSSSWTKSLLNCIWFSIYKQRTKFKSTVEYGNFEIHRKDCLRLTFIHWSHVILRHCRVIYIVCIDWTNGAEPKWGRIWTMILPMN